MPSRDFFIEMIDREFAAARSALAQGNDGKARVAARRAAGLAVGWHIQESGAAGWGPDAMTRLRRAAGEAAFPAEVREAAQRLTAKISPSFGYAVSADPLGDASVIVSYFLRHG